MFALILGVSSLSIFLVLQFTIESAYAFNAPGGNETMNIKVKQAKSTIYRAEWNNKGRWTGRAWWANPLFDWKCLGNRRVQAPAAKNRALSLLPFEITVQGSSFTIQTVVKFSKSSNRIPSVANSVSAGFGLGRRGPFNDYRSAAVYARSQLRAVINSKGKLLMGNKYSSKSLSSIFVPTKLTLKGTRLKNNSVSVSLTAQQAKKKVSVTHVVSLSKVTGVFALITEGPAKDAEETARVNVIFEDFSITGSMLKRYNGRMFGAVMWSQYTVSKKTLRLQAQLAPIDKPMRVQLLIRSTKNGKPIHSRVSWSDKLSRTVRFTVGKLDTSRHWWYDVQLHINGQLHSWSGVIQMEPPLRLPFKIAVFSCDNGYLFPLQSVVTQVSTQKPHMLYFAGDQIYSDTAGFSFEQFAKTEVAMIDFLRRWYLFGWTWRKLLRNAPSVIIPDDHDVYQGNLWGAGGRAIKEPKQKYWETGGYVMPGRWVTAVEQCHVGHLPPPRASFRTPLGLSPYFTSLLYAGLSMAVLEDRKFKSAPLEFPKSEKKLADGGSLLGYKQEAFLSKWVKEWHGASMKIAFSQTIFCDAATHTGETLRRHNFAYDSGGWPSEARNRAVKLLGKGNVLSLHGDQHLGILLRQGVDRHDDANVAFMVPGTANGYPRAWWPGVQNIFTAGKSSYTGRFVDDIGHPITVLAVGNPEPKSLFLDTSKISPMQYGRVKGSGYGLVVINRETKSAVFNLYRVGKAFDQFKGFPKKVLIGGRPKNL